MQRSTDYFYNNFQSDQFSFFFKNSLVTFNLCWQSKNELEISESFEISGIKDSTLEHLFPGLI